MWIMTLDAGLYRVVQFRYNLRKPGRPRREVFMAQRTIPPLSWHHQLDCLIVLDVQSGRPVTNLTGNVSVVPFCFDIYDIIVAVVTSLVTCILDIKRNIGFNRRGAEMSVLAEVVGNQRLPRCNECCDHSNENDK